MISALLQVVPLPSRTPHTARAAAVVALLLWTALPVDFPGEGKLCHSGRRGAPGQQPSARFRKGQGCLFMSKKFGPSANRRSCGAAAVGRRAVLVWWCRCSGAAVPLWERRGAGGHEVLPHSLPSSPTHQHHRLLEWVLHSPIAHSTVGLLRGNEGNKI